MSFNSSLLISFLVGFFALDSVVEVGWEYGAGGWICGGLGRISLLFSGFRGVVLGRVSAILSRRVR